MNEKIVILDFGSQYTQLIARRVRELNIFCEIQPYNKPINFEENVKAVILSGSPFSVKEKKALKIDLKEFVGKVPVLGVCYGAQYVADYYGGKVMRSEKREYGKANLTKIHKKDPFLKGIKKGSQVWMSHGDTIFEIPKGFELLAGTEHVDVAAYRSNGQFEKPLYCIQFHPEVTHSLDGLQLLKNFLVDIAKCKQNWTPAAFVDSTVEELKRKVGDDKVLLGLSGGVDSSVAAMLLHRAIGKNLVCFFIDNGLLRKDEFEEVLDSYKGLGLNVVGVDSKNDFYKALERAGRDPEKKRKAIGKTFIKVFQAEANKLKGIKWLGQGTIYPDVIESVSVHGPSVTIKSHHNVGGLPKRMKLKIVEPLRMLFKDEVRKVGKEVGLPDFIVGRHPFPGPGLAIRVLGKITPEKVALLQEADAIFINNLKKFDLYDKVWQAGAILTPVQSVGVMGDERTYENVVALRCVNSVDGMTAEWSRLPHDFLATVSSEIINNVKGINRVVYDISTKPPATIEWE